MAKLFIVVSATIVLIFASAKSEASPQEEIPESTTEEPSPWPEEPPDENLSVTEPPPAPERPGRAASNARYYPYRQALTFRAGVASPSAPKLNFNDQILGFQYLFPKFLSPKLEAGADLHEEGRGHIHVGARWIYNEKGYFRPSGKIALDHLVDSEEKLATFGEFDNYFARASGTLEYVVWNPYSLRLETEYYINFSRRGVALTLGLSRGW